MAVCCFITAAATSDVLTGSMHSGPERSFDPALSDHRRRAKRKRLTTRNDGTPVSGQGCSVVHDLRHTFATLALSAGEHYMQVSKWLGAQHVYAYLGRLRRLHLKRLHLKRRRWQGRTVGQAGGCKCNYERCAD